MPCLQASIHLLATDVQCSPKGDRASPVAAVPSLPAKAQEPASSDAQQAVTADPPTDAASVQECLQDEKPAQNEVVPGQAGSQDGPDGILEECQSIAQARAAADGQSDLAMAEVRQNKTPAAASRPAEKENTPTNALQGATGKPKRKSGSGQASTA